MIDVHDGKITDLFSNSFSYNPETISIAYAILQEKRRLLALAERTRLMAAVDVLEERILDYLAVELRTPAYSDSQPIETKRALIKGTLPYYAKLGTPMAVNWVINTIFGKGGIEEWFEYGGDPHHFRIQVTKDHAVFTIEEFEEFVHTIYTVKRLTSWLDEIIITIPFPPSSLHVGGGLGHDVEIGIPAAADVYDNFTDRIFTGGGFGVDAEVGIPAGEDSFSFRHKISTGGTFGENVEIGVPAGEDSFSFRHKVSAGGTFGEDTEVGVPAEADSYTFNNKVSAGGTFGAAAAVGVPEDTQAAQVSSKVRTGGKFSAQQRIARPEDTAPPPSTTILKTGGVFTIISNKSRGE